MVHGFSGWNRTLPERTTSIAGFASSFMSQNHCSEISGSIRRPERCECGTSCSYGSSPEIAPSVRSAATTAVRASSTSRPANRSPAAVRHPAVLADHRDLLEPVPAADLEVVRVVPRGDLQAARPELGVDVLVGDHRQAAPDQRQDHRAPDELCIALVARVDGDGRVGQHRLRPDGGDGHRPAAVGERVVDRVERVGQRALLDLEVGDRRAQPGIPVDHVVVAIDVAPAVQLDEHVSDGACVGLVHREALVRVVRRRPEALELLDDLRAVLLAPLPDALHELLASQLEPRRPLLGKLLLDHRLRPDPGVVRAQDPAGRRPAHPLEADQGVLDRAVERVAHVQRAGDVRGRDRDRVVVVSIALGFGVEPTALQPALEHARLDLAGFPAGGGLQFRPTCGVH